jgi:hypothetical protein
MASTLEGVFAMPTKDVIDYQLITADLTTAQRRKAVIAVASAAGDAGECARLLDMLGLSAEEVHPRVPAPRG